MDIEFLSYFSWYATIPTQTYVSFPPTTPISNVTLAPPIIAALMFSQQHRILAHGCCKMLWRCRARFFPCPQQIIAIIQLLNHHNPLPPTHHPPPTHPPARTCLKIFAIFACSTRCQVWKHAPRTRLLDLAL